MIGRRAMSKRAHQKAFQVREPCRPICRKKPIAIVGVGMCHSVVNATSIKTFAPHRAGGSLTDVHGHVIKQLLA